MKPKLILRCCQQDFKKRAPYITYLVKLRQDLSMTHDHLLKQKEAVLRTKALYLQYYKSVRIHNYIEKKEADIVKSVSSPQFPGSLK